MSPKKKNARNSRFKSHQEMMMAQSMSSKGKHQAPDLHHHQSLLHVEMEMLNQESSLETLFASSEFSPMKGFVEKDEILFSRHGFQFIRRS